MAAPNIVNVSTITGKTAVANVTQNTTNTFITNSGGSNQVYKINTITIANYQASALSANVNISRSSANYLVIGNVSVPSNSTIVVSGKDTAFYLEEGDSLNAITSANCYLISSYEIIG